MGTRMLQRRGTTAEWTAANPVLGDGEFGYNRTTGEVRMGDGVTAWNALPNSNIYIPKATLDSLYSPIGAIPASLVDAAGDLLVGSADNTVVRLGKGADGQYLSVTGGALVWSNLPVVANPFAVVTTAEDLIVGSGNGTVKRVGKGANGQVLTVVGGVLTWATPSAVDTTKVAKTGDTMTGRLQFLFSGRGAGAALDNNQGQLRVRNDADTAYADIVAQGVYEGNYRVYSPNNPPPASGVTLRQVIRGTFAWASYAANVDCTISLLNTAKAELRSQSHLVPSRLTSAASNFQSGSMQIISTTTMRANGPYMQVDASGGSGAYEITEWN